MTFSNRDTVVAAPLDTDPAEVLSATTPSPTPQDQPDATSTEITSPEPDEFVSEQQQQRLAYETNPPETYAPMFIPPEYSLTGSPAEYEQIKNDALELQNALRFDLDSFLDSQKQQGVPDVDALVEAKVQILQRMAIMAAFNSGQIDKDQALAMLNGTADKETMRIVTKRVTFLANPQMSPSLNLEAYTSSNIRIIEGAQDANNDVGVFRTMLDEFVNSPTGDYQQLFNGLQGSAPYFGNPAWDPYGLAAALALANDARGMQPNLGNGSTPTPDQDASMSSGNSATDIINQASAILEARDAIEANKRTLASKYGINDIASAEEWKKLAGGRRIAYSEELYAVLFDESGIASKDKEEIEQLLAGDTLDANLRPMVEAYAELQSDSAQLGTFEKVREALSLAHTITHLSQEIDESAANFQQRYDSFNGLYTASPDKDAFLQSFDTTEAGAHAIEKLSAQLIRDMNPENDPPDIVPASEHAKIQAFANDLGITGFDQDISTLNAEQIAALVREAEKLVRAAEYVHLRNNPHTITDEQFEQLRAAVGIEPSILDAVVAKYKSDSAVGLLGDLCAPGEFALALSAGAVLQTR
jgi:hypothetical protein